MDDAIVSLQLHPKNEHRLYAQMRHHQIICLDAANEIVLNTLGAVDSDSNPHSKFTITPCGSIVCTILWDTICMHNILTGTVQSSLKVPYVKNRRHSYISHLDYHPKSFLLSVAVYDANGGIVLLSHRSESHDSMDGGHKEAVYESVLDDRWQLVKQNVHSKSSELLGTIIQRIDDIMHQPHLSRNETDDFKNENQHRSQNMERNVAAYVQMEPLNISSDDSDSDVKSDGTFTVHKNESISEASNRTFTLNKNATPSCSKVVQRVNDGTYSIQANDTSDEDDTTISESM